MPKICYFLFGAFLLLFNPIYAQQGISSGGASISTSAGQMSFVVGQIFYENIGSKASVSGGVLQVYTKKALILSALTESSVQILPNPVYDHLVIQLEDASHLLPEITYQIYDLYGRIMETKKIYDLQTAVDMQHYLPGIYTLLIQYPNQKPIPFKLIKL